ncbi:uncharacterized protein LOC128232143 isoform X1 [Mya arenaria]|uniref:uncharacterized protein LOC128232143 isoform X1 n=1 Tax=Mya arenaria TaxID=6604 RepID=UPI0022E1CFF5|nr:uncharacterized protein LOC128232143 isoform X1 [Mya arenaria]XP_052801491.1 uncharacterized protein LOC128232143 isoform X1 [Mya arenaria]
MMRKHWRGRPLMVLGGLGIIVIFILLVRSSNNAEQKPIDLHEPCAETLKQSKEKNLEKVASYKFPQADHYLEDLLGAHPGDGNMPKDPVFLSAFSQSHFIEGMDLVKNVSTIRKILPNSKFIIYNLGMSEKHKVKVLAVCDCELRLFPFERFPDFVGIMKGYAWKPLAIQLVARDHPFVIWMDASVRFITKDLQPWFDKVRNLGVLASVGHAPVAMRTHPLTFQTLVEKQCTFREDKEFEATFIMIYGTMFVREYFLKPWVSCALTKGCLVPDESPSKYINCNGDASKPHYFDCHRFDQSILSILLLRLYHENIQSHIMHHEFYRFCKSADEEWYLPQFVNEFRVANSQTCM